MKDFMHNLKYYKAISVAGESGSGVDTKVEVPIDLLRNTRRCYVITL